MFPGQGSQAKGMGAELFAQFPQQVQQIDELLGYSIAHLCLHDPHQLLGNTQYTQPALYVVEALSFLEKAPNTPPPDYCIGHSLGEYSALFAASAFDLLTGLKLVKKRGELMAKATGGGMLAVINLSEAHIKSLLQTHNLNTIDFANFNSNKQIVLSGPEAEISKANEILSQEAMMCIPLKVSGAFHSRYMHDAAEEFAQYLTEIEVHPLQIPVIANVNNELYTTDTIKTNLVKQITHPVHWSKIIRSLKDKGETNFVEVGPGNVLTRLVPQC
jgi:malonyl CoA-acyl carrier protein transacylase